MKYYVFSRYRQGINTSWLNEQIKNNPKSFKTLKENKSGAWYRFFTGYWGGRQECKSRSMKKMEG